MTSLKDESKWYWNAMRGICIILVIFIHVTVPVYADGTLRWEWYFLRKLTAFPVAMFFFMAGFFVHPDKVNSKRYIWRKIKRILFPYLLFSTVYILLSTLLGSDSNWKGIMANYLLGTAEIQMYYCVYLIQMILLLPLLRYCIDKKCRNAVLLGILFLSMAVAYIKGDLGVSNTFLRTICFTFLIYYVLGLYVRGYMERRYESACLDFFRKQKLCAVEVSVIVAFLLAFAEGTRTYPNLNCSQVSLGNYLYCMTIIMLGMNIYWKCGRDGGAFCPTVLKPIVWLGEQSFDVYLFHMIIMRPMIVLFENSNIEYPLQQLLLFGGTLGGSVIILLAKEQISKKIGKRTD